MAYSPEDIVAYEFRTRTRGYDRAEVDELLDALADQVERDQQDLDDLRARLRDAERRLGDALESEAALKRGLVAAQDAAERALEEAREQAAEAWAAAEREIEERLRAAEAQAQAIRATAEAEATEYREELAALRAVDEGHRDRLRAHLHEQLRLLDELPSPPEFPSERSRGEPAHHMSSPHEPSPDEPSPDESSSDDGRGVEEPGVDRSWEPSAPEDRDHGSDLHGDPQATDDPGTTDDLGPYGDPAGWSPERQGQTGGPEGDEGDDGDDGEDVRPSPIWG